MTYLIPTHICKMFESYNMEQTVNVNALLFSQDIIINMTPQQRGRWLDGISEVFSSARLHVMPHVGSAVSGSLAPSMI